MVKNAPVWNTGIGSGFPPGPPGAANADTQASEVCSHLSGLVLTHKISPDAAGNVFMDSDAQMPGVFRPTVIDLWWPRLSSPGLSSC